MRNVLFILLAILCIGISCKKEKTASFGYHLEDFRKEGMDDYQTLLAAFDSVPNGETILFDPKTYVFSHTPIILDKTFHFNGPATLKREDQISYKLKVPADENSTIVVLDHTDGIIPWDRFLITLGQDYKKTTSINVVLAIKGDTLILNQPLGRTVDNQNGTYPAGTHLFKNINFFWILSSTGYPEQRCTFTDLIFDGNRDNNKGSYSWLLNAALTALTKGYTQFKNCDFINSPAETIIGHNVEIRDCKFKNLNGSAFHTSADKVQCSEAEIHSYLTGNLFENTNEILSTIGGHSEGVITHSNSGGYYTATKNIFINVGESVLGALYPSNSIHDWGTSNIEFTGNVIIGAGRMVYLIDTSLQRGPIHDVIIEKNSISGLTDKRNWSDELEHWPDIILKNESMK